MSNTFVNRESRSAVTSSDGITTYVTRLSRSSVVGNATINTYVNRISRATVVVLKDSIVGGWNPKNAKIGK